ncbi:hypothetical protein GGS21DRAFT_429361 [Xylaria nigripes]|nr:hypothetical protein GGS21DRAFT_429361 [Xylaria nigripes]
MDSNTDTGEHFLGPVPDSGATLFRLEVERREDLRRRGPISTGCPEIDDALLSVGGFERGSVVGVSAEVVDFGVLFGLQTIARALVFGHGDSTGEFVRKVAVVTTLPAATILPILRDVVRSQALIKFGPGHVGVDGEVRRCLELISISRVFDIEGLWEVLLELGGGLSETVSRRDGDRFMSPPVPGAERLSENERDESDFTDETRRKKDYVESGAEREEGDPIDNVPLEFPPEPPASSPSPVTELPPLRIGPELRPPIPRAEILDSEDEEPFSSPLSSPPPSTIAPRSASPSEERPQAPNNQDPHPTQPSIPSPESRPIFKPQDPQSKPPTPEIILITHFAALLTTLFTHHDKKDAHATLQRLSSHLHNLARSAGPLILLLNTTTTTTTTAAHAQKPHPLDPSLRSIFNQARRTKPAFGLTFAQLLDLHLLCTRHPRTRDDAEALVTGVGTEDVCYAWVVEALLDELGACGTSRSREGRWAAVDVRGGVRLVDAFSHGRRD